MSGHAVLRSVLGTLTGPRGLVVACVTDRRLLWGAVSTPAECSSLDANTRDLQLTTLTACHCRVRPAPPRPLTRVSAYSVSVWRFCGLCGWRPLLTDGSTGSHLLLSPPRAIWGAGTAQGKKKPLTTCSSPTHVPPAFYTMTPGRLRSVDELYLICGSARRCRGTRCIQVSVRDLCVPGCPAS